jgi:hypothetical protein
MENERTKISDWANEVAVTAQEYRAAVNNFEIRKKEMGEARERLAKAKKGMKEELTRLTRGTKKAARENGL